ncbi:MAG: hypothetical protein EHM13_04530 [Acidobacteria bacterium]|nr:MAG: hypothetical protein EHM13_04530 [Acidobacteriota bacterium]
MRVSETGEARVRGYLFVLGRSLRTFLQPAEARDALREVESHIRERLEQVESSDERVGVEQVLAELGTPLKVARAYSTEMTLDEALTTGRFVPVLRAVWHLATTSVFGFLWALFVFVGWVFGLAVMSLAPVKVVFPNNVGIFYQQGQIQSMGANFGHPPGTEVYVFGYWIVPVALALGLGILVLTHRASRRVLGWIRSRRPPARVRLKVEVSGR